MSKLDFAHASVRSHRFLEDIVGVPVDEARPMTPRRNASIMKMCLELGRVVGGVGIGGSGRSRIGVGPNDTRIVEEVTLIIEAQCEFSCLLSANNIEFDSVDVVVETI